MSLDFDESSLGLGSFLRRVLLHASTVWYEQPLSKGLKQEFFGLLSIYKGYDRLRIYPGTRA